MYWQCFFFYFFTIWFSSYICNVICYMSFHFVWLLVLVVWSTFPLHCSSVRRCMCQHSELFTHQQCDMGAVNNLQFKQFDRLNLSSKIERFLSNQFESSSHSCNRHPNKAIECFYLFDWLYLIHSSCNTFHFSFDYAEVRARSSEP